MRRREPRPQGAHRPLEEARNLRLRTNGAGCHPRAQAMGTDGPSCPGACACAAPQPAFPRPLKSLGPWLLRLLRVTCP